MNKRIEEENSTDEKYGIKNEEKARLGRIPT